MTITTIMIQESTLPYLVTKCLFYQILKNEMADKPGSVEDNHSSRTNVTACLKQPTQERYGPYLFTEANCSSIWSCSRWGLPCHNCYQSRGALLPHPFTLTESFKNDQAVYFLLH